MISKSCKWICTKNSLSCPCSRNTVSRVLKRADELNLSWPLPEEQTNSALEDLLYPKGSSSTQKKRLPNLDSIHKELLKQGVNKKLLPSVTVIPRILKKY